MTTSGIYDFVIPGHSTQRKWAVYIVKISSEVNQEKYYYVGKVGDNRFGCNPLISRIGNHFSFNKFHSQIRNKLKEKNKDSTEYNYQVFYVTFGIYNENEHNDKREVINELERTLNLFTQNKIKLEQGFSELLNPYEGKTLTKEEKLYRDGLLSDNERNTLKGLVNKAFTIRP